MLQWKLYKLISTNLQFTANLIKNLKYIYLENLQDFEDAEALSIASKSITKSSFKAADA